MDYEHEQPTKTLTVRCSAELHKRIKIACVNDGVEMNAVLLEILEREFEGPAPKTKVARSARPAVNATA